MSNAASLTSSSNTTSGTPLSPDYPVDILSNVRNPRGIPTMLFFEDPATVLASKGAPVDAVLQSLQTMHSKFKLMEGALIETRKRCKAQVPDLESSLSVVQMLKSKREKQQEEGATFDTYFNLSDQVYAQAQVNPSGKCCIWLGANIMIEYTYEEAETMLSANLETVKKKFQDADEDLAHVKDQLTTTEVNMSRTYNFEVQQRRISKQSASINNSEDGASGKKKGGVEARVTLGGKTITVG